MFGRWLHAGHSLLASKGVECQSAHIRWRSGWRCRNSGEDSTHNNTPQRHPQTPRYGAAVANRPGPRPLGKGPWAQLATLASRLRSLLGKLDAFHLEIEIGNDGEHHSWSTKLPAIQSYARLALHCSMKSVHTEEEVRTHWGRRLGC